MINQVVHIGITVSNLEKSIDFYKNLLGFDFLGKIEMNGKESDILFGRKNVSAKIAYLSGSKEILSPPVELIEFTDKESKKDKTDLFRTSISEICFLTDDIEKEYKRLKKEGVEFISRPCSFDFSDYGFSKSKAVYLRDPDGNILELIEEIE